MLFGVLAVVNRPFEAHLFRHGYQKPADISRSPHPSFGQPLTRNLTWTLEKRIDDRPRSVSTHRSRSFETVNRSKGLAQPIVSAPSRVRSSDSRIFTSPYTPPPIPPAYIAAQRNSSAYTSDRSSHSSMNRGFLTRPPRLSGSTRIPESVPLSVPAQYPMSTWRAIHPEGPTSVPLSTHSRPRSYSTGLSYQSEYSRSSVFLTRPARLSNSRSSSRHGSEELKGRNDRFSSSIVESKSASPRGGAYAIKHGTPLAHTEHVKRQIGHHTRTASAPQAASHREFQKEADVKIVTRKPVPVRQLRSANRVGISSAFIYAEAAEDSVNRMLSDSRNKLGSAGSVKARTMTFEQVKNKPLPKIAIFSVELDGHMVPTR